MTTAILVIFLFLAIKIVTKNDLLDEEYGYPLSEEEYIDKNKNNN